MKQWDWWGFMVTAGLVPYLVWSGSDWPASWSWGWRGRWWCPSSPPASPRSFSSPPRPPPSWRWPPLLWDSRAWYRSQCLHREMVSLGLACPSKPELTWCGEDGVSRMRLDTVDDVSVGLQHHDEVPSVPVPGEQMAAVAAWEDKPGSPPGRLLDHRPGVPVAGQLP